MKTGGREQGRREEGGRAEYAAQQREEGGPQRRGDEAEIEEQGEEAIRLNSFRTLEHEGGKILTQYLQGVVLTP